LFFLLFLFFSLSFSYLFLFALVKVVYVQARTCMKSFYHPAVFPLRNNFFNSHQPLMVIIKLQFNSNESGDAKKQTQNETNNNSNQKNKK